MIRIVVTLLMFAALGGAAAADAEGPAQVPQLKELVTVTSEIVRIGDLVENAGAAADIPVFRAPDLGQTGAVPVARIADALRPHGLARLETRGLSEVVVTRLSRTITPDDIKDRIARAVAGQFGYGDAGNLAVMLDRDMRTLHVEATLTADLAIDRMHVEPRTGRFDIAFELPGSLVVRRTSMRFTGSITELVPAATLARALRPGEIVKASDVLVERRPKAEIGPYAIMPEQAVGLAAKSALRGGQVLRPADLIKAQVVQRNEAVVLVYDVPGVALTVRGKATESGAIGDVINVLNVQSNRSVQGTVIAPGRIAIAAIRPQMAAAAVPADRPNPTQ
jgi:flagella basal body P-ring formation protein FlgA